MSTPANHNVIKTVKNAGLKVAKILGFAALATSLNAAPANAVAIKSLGPQAAAVKTLGPQSAVAIKTLGPASVPATPSVPSSAPKPETPTR